MKGCPGSEERRKILAARPTLTPFMTGVKCPHCGKEIPDRSVRKYVMSLQGRKTGKSKARDPEKMRAAALKRWAKAK
jgi:hypothetical protein